jgi:hypothetical protein
MRARLEIAREREAAERRALGLKPAKPGSHPFRQPRFLPVTVQAQKLAAELLADRKSRRLALIRKAAAGA